VLRAGYTLLECSVGRGDGQGAPLRPVQACLAMLKGMLGLSGFTVIDCTSLPSTMAPVSIGQDHLPQLQLPQLQLDGDVFRDAEVHGPGAGGVGELADAANQAHLIRTTQLVAAMESGL
jgi:hypothetical protein